MTPKFTSLSFWEIAKLAFLFQFIGLVGVLITSIFLSTVFPSWVRATMDMDQWNFPATALFFCGYVSILLFPFIVLGSWLVVLMARKILGIKKDTPNNRIQPTRETRAADA
jgi:hypothetical protein